MNVLTDSLAAGALAVLQDRSRETCAAFSPLKKALLCDWLFAIRTNMVVRFPAPRCS